MTIKRPLWILVIIGFIYGLIVIGRSIHFYIDNNSPFTSNVAENPSLYPHDPTFCAERCKKIDTDMLIKDENGVFMVDSSKLPNMRSGNDKVYYPTTVGQMVLAHRIRYERFKDENDLKTLITNADWFTRSLNEHGCWPFTIDINYSKGKTIKAPFCSAMGQGLAFSALVSAYEVTNDKKYLEVAKAGLPPFNLDHPQSVLSLLSDGSVFLEELGSKEESIHILNGYIFALIGLYDLSRATQDPFATQLYKDGVETLKKHALSFETGNWSLYSMDPQSNIYNHWRYASPKYQRLHTIQFQALADLTKEPVFQETYLRHKSYMESSWINFIIIPAYLVYQDLSWLVRMIKS